MISTVLLIVMIGYSPSGATGAAPKVTEYAQPSVSVCQAEAKKITNMPYNGFKVRAFCLTADKEI